MKTAIDRLVQLGISEYESRAYVALVKENPASPYEIAKISGIPTSKIYEVIRKLESRHMVQSIHGERSRMYIPVAPDEFVQNFRYSLEDSLETVSKELRGITGGMDTSYTWHIKNYESLIARSKRMIDTSQESILLSVWPREAGLLLKPVSDAENRGVKIAIVHYGATNIRVGRIYRHPVEDTLHARKGTRGFTLVADSREVLAGKITDIAAEAIWSMNEGFVMMTEDYIRHDIYVMKIMERFDPVLREKFGLRYEKLLDIHTDE